MSTRTQPRKRTRPEATQPDAPATFRPLPFMGVIRVNEEARNFGFSLGDPAWSNLGQGQPEVGDIPGAPERFATLEIAVNDHAYGPVEGLSELREAIAAHYNRLYRKGLPSQYTAENVAVAPGGRTALSRCGASLDIIRLGYFTPDYTAYEDLLTTFSRVEPVWIELKADDGFRIDSDDLDQRIRKEQLTAVLISNPCNPTGIVIQGDELRSWVEIARRRRCTLLMDEFYSHYVYADGQSGAETDPSSIHPVSTAAFVEDVNKDPVVIFDGLTKCFRYPGWRVGWVVAPKDIIRTMTAAGSFLDGGPPRPIQRAAIAVLQPRRADQETQAVRAHFATKQWMTLESLRGIGVTFPGRSEGTFYVWGSVADLPPPLDDGLRFMYEAFKHRVLTVPGEFFDVNPNRLRPGESRLKKFVRFSFGPPRENLQSGLERLVVMVRHFA